MDLHQLITEATPGSIWMRTDGSRARVIAITNLSLPAESQQKYVPVVVYIGPSGKVFSRPLKDFAGYFPTWLGQDSGAESTIMSLMTPLNAPKPDPVTSPDDDSIDMSGDAPSAPVAPSAKPAVQVREKAKLEGTITAAAPPAMPNLLRAAFQVGNDEDRKTPALTSEQLSRSLRVYSQVPDEHLGLVVHKLSFELSPNLTIDGLKEVFSPDEWVNTVDVFRIGTPVSDETVGVDAFIGVYPEFTRSVLYGTVYVGVDMVPVNNQSVQSHASQINQNTAQESKNPQESPVVHNETPNVESKVDKEPEGVLGGNAVQDAKGAPSVPAEVEAPTSAEPVPEGSPVASGDMENSDLSATEVPAAPDSTSAPVQDRPVKKKRGPKPKKVVAVEPADDELDVDTLS